MENTSYQIPEYYERLEFLKGKTHISVPELQISCGISYSEAVLLMERLDADHVVSHTVEGVEREVDTKRVNARELSLDECCNIFYSLPIDVSSAVCQMSRHMRFDRLKDEDATSELTSKHERDFKTAQEHGLMHCFDGQWSLSITHSSANRLKSIIDNNGDILGPTIVTPLIKACIEERIVLEELLECCLLPEECRERIVDGLKKYREQGVIANVDCRAKTSFAQRDAIATAILESFVKNYDYTTKWEFLAAAKLALDYLEDSPAVSRHFLVAAREVIRRIDTEYETADLLRLRKELLSGKEEYAELTEDDFDTLDDILEGFDDDDDDDE